MFPVLILLPCLIKSVCVPNQKVHMKKEFHVVLVLKFCKSHVKRLVVNIPFVLI